MDRREALKKLAIGGGAAVGTTAILTSPAFAGTAPTTPAPTVAIPDHADMNTNAVVTVSQAEPGCSRSQTSFTITGTVTATAPMGGSVTGSPASFTTMGTPRTASLTLVGSMGDLGAGDTSTITVVTTATCNYPANPMTLTSTCTTVFLATASVASMSNTTMWAITTSTAQMCV